MEIDPPFVAALIIVTAAGLIFGLTGFGFALISVPVLLFVYDPATVVMLTLVLTLFTCALVILDAWRSAELRVVLTMLPGAVVGLFAGAYLLAVASPDVIKVIAGAVVIVFSLVMLRGVRLPGGRHPAAPVIAGVTSGLLATSTGLSSPPPVMLLNAREFPRDTFRVNMAVYFVIINAIGLGALLTQAQLTADQFTIAASLLPPTILGTLAGARLARLVPSHHFRQLTLVLLLLTGAMGVVTAIVALA